MLVVVVVEVEVRQQASIHARGTKRTQVKRKRKKYSKICMRKISNWEVGDASHIQRKLSRILCECCLADEEMIEHESLITTQTFDKKWMQILVLVLVVKFKYCMTITILNVLMMLLWTCCWNSKAVFWVSKFRTYTPWLHFASQNVSWLVLPNA